MNYNAMTDEAIGIELGNRIKALRLRKDITQQELADATTYSRKAIQSLESGKAKLTTVIAVLRHLGQLGTLDAFIPETPTSPIELAKMKNNERQRGSGLRGLNDSIERAHITVTKK
ncbi:hypothetical protein MNBD_GAMMA06-2172 [hydrothermal vent metagenome]|uniref:HTH cro/C1-type domain-containing protein n=1 Tax=hydrothermal vent metagenome TaxID=652676 RepID=A0A3B0X5K8_9ZZZZ